MFAIGIIAARYFEEPGIVVSSIILAVLIIIAQIYTVFKTSSDLISFGIISAIIFMCGYLVYTGSDYSRQNYEDFYLENVKVTGVVESVTLGKDYKRVILVNCSFTKNDTSFRPKEKLLISVYETKGLDKLYPTDTLIFTGNVESISDISNPGEYSTRSYYLPRGINAKASLMQKSKFEIYQSSSNSFSGVIHRVRKGVSSVIDSVNVSEITRGIIKALLLGERTEINFEVYDDFAEGGILHVLAVSGLHTGYIVFLLLVLFSRLGLRARLFLTIPALLLFVFISGGNPPVIRAVVMAIVYMTAILLGRDGEPFNSMALAFTILLIFEPFALFEAGFQLSFAAVSGILIMLRLLEPFYRKYSISGTKRKLFSTVSATIAAQLATIPILLYHWGYFSATALINNFFAVPLIGLILLASIITLSFYPVGDLIAGIFAASTELFTQVLISLTKISNIILGLIVSLNVSALWIILYFIIVMCLLWIIFTKRTPLKKMIFSAGLILGFIIITPAITRSPLSNELLNLIMFEAGQGDSFLIINPNGKTILIDSGNYHYPDTGLRTIIPFLRRNGIDKIDIAFISHLDADHAGGSLSLIKKGLIKHIYIPPKIENRKYLEYNNFLEDNKVLIEEYSPKKIEFDNVGIYILRDYLQDSSLPVSENDRSGVLKIIYGDISFLFTGDAGFLVEEKLIQKYADFLNADVLKVSHHGSKYGTSGEFLKFVTPEYSLISCGKRNRYGHPAKQVLENLETINSQVLRTDSADCVILSTDGRKLSVVDWRNW